jgi:hypothetical protein
VQIAKDHVSKMQKVEKHKQIKLKERQEAFQDAFDQDVDFYRTHGRLERKVHLLLYFFVSYITFYDTHHLETHLEKII